MNSDSLNALIHSFYKAEHYFFKSISKEVIDLRPNVHGYLTGVDFDFFNPLMLRAVNTDINKVLNEASKFFKHHGLPWIIVIPKHCQHLAEATLIEYGFKLSEQCCMLMAYDLNQTVAPENPIYNQNIKPTNANLDEWIHPLIEAFESTNPISQQYKNTHITALSNKANFYHFTAYQNNIPVASITLSINENMARIDDLGTLPAYQNKGHATALIQHVLTYAKDLHATQCFLEASTSGLSLYKKLGFTELFKNNIFNIA